MGCFNNSEGEQLYMKKFYDKFCIITVFITFNIAFNFACAEDI